MTDAVKLQQCFTYLEAQLGPRPKRPPRPSRPPTVTISRMTGAGGIPIAERLAAYLQSHRPASPAPWTVFHRSLVEKVLADHKLPGGLSAYMPEDRVSYLQDTLEELLGLHPSSTSLATRTTETILKLAELGNCIVVGRGAHVILARAESALHIRLTGSLEKRVARIMEDRQLDAGKSRELIAKEDTARRRYLKTNFDADVDDPLGYHLVLNTDFFTTDESAELIGRAVLGHFKTSS